MPPENQSTLSLNGTSCDTTTATSKLTSTCNTTLYNTTGNILVSDGNSFNWACVSGTSSISSYNTSSSSIISYSNFDPGYRSAKDGEVRIDPETGESLIFLSEYGKWIECDVELEKIKDENGNNKNIVSATFNISVSKLKTKQKERMVLTEKVKKTIELSWVTSGFITTGNIGLANITPYNTITIGTDPYYLTNETTNTGTLNYINGTTNLNNTITLI